jgi:predicted transcriptional regulator of viral defense system
MKPGTRQDVQKVLREQKQVITRKQARKAGLTRRFIDKRLKLGRWRRSYRGVYVTVTGSVPREAQLRAALLRAGAHAVLSHWSAAEMHKLIDKPFAVIHITVPEARDPARWGKIPGVRVHRSDVILHEKHLAAKTLPCTSLEDTVIDLINACETFDAAYNWICKALGGGFTTIHRFKSAMGERKRVRYRRDIQRVLEAASGALSWLELRYVQGVEAPHGLPKASRQVRVRQDTGSKYLDNLYEEYTACIELDGAVAHPEDEQWKDKDRDRWNLVYNQVVTARLGVQHLRTSEDMCQTAADVTKILNDRGPAVGYACTRPGCVVPDYVARG